MFARGSGTDGEVGKTGVRRVERELCGVTPVAGGRLGPRQMAATRGQRGLAWWLMLVIVFACAGYRPRPPWLVAAAAVLGLPLGWWAVMALERYRVRRKQVAVIVAWAAVPIMIGAGFRVFGWGGAQWNAYSRTWLTSAFMFQLLGSVLARWRHDQRLRGSVSPESE